jgi:hypothetical protein
MKKILIILLVLIGFITSSAEPSTNGLLFAQSARWAVGQQVLQVEGTQYNLDCSGVIYAVCQRSGLMIAPMIWPYEGNGVSRLYQLLEDNELLMDTPQPGDLIFWDNSYDYNGNGLADDQLTHVGIITEIDADGLIHFVHYHYRLGIIEAQMDPMHPDDEERNSPMRSRTAP